jgi:hypothetical protein
VHQQDPDSEVEGDHMSHEAHQWSQPKRKQIVMKKKVRVSAQPTRQSSRIIKDGVSISEKATKRAMELNNILGNSFALFNLVDNKYLQDLAADSDIRLGEIEEDIDQQTDAIRALEIAQIAIEKLDRECKK